jgi:hypothetical protein
MNHVWGDDFRVMLGDSLYNEAVKLYRLTLWDLQVANPEGYAKLKLRAAKKWRLAL